MPHYFFYLENRSGAIEDDEGCDLPDLHAARDRAVESIRSILSEEIKDGVVDLKGHVDVKDSAGAVLLHLPFADAVEVRGSHRAR